MKWILWGLAAVSVPVVIIVTFGGHGPNLAQPSEAEPQAISPAERPGGVLSQGEGTSAARLGNTTSAPRTAQATASPIAAEPGTVVRIKPGQTLATVNGVAITLQDLMSVPADKADMEHPLPAERYNFLLNRAIEREVTFQAARSQGVQLTDSQGKRLEELRIRSEQVEPGVFDTVEQNPANVAFEQRDAMGLLLQAALAERAGVPSPHVTAAQVQAYYDAHETDYGALPADPSQRQAAWERIDQAIRVKLAPGLQAEHQQRLQQFVEQLKTAVNIEVLPL